MLGEGPKYSSRQLLKNNKEAALTEYDLGLCPNCFSIALNSRAIVTPNTILNVSPGWPRIEL